MKTVARKGFPNDKLKTKRLLQNWTQEQLAEKLGTTRVNINRWEKGSTVPGLFFRQKLCDIFNVSSDELGFPSPSDILKQASFATQHEGWVVPYQRNPFFTGRENVLFQIYEALDPENKTITNKSCALSGLAGIGKTQLAIEYAYQYADKYSAVFWVRSETYENIVSSIITIAGLLHLPEQQESLQLMNTVIRWFTNHSNWLLILDNVEDPALVKDILPAARNGCLLFTSRRHTLGFATHIFNLEPMTLEEGTHFLLRRARLLNSNAARDKLSLKEKVAAEEVVSIVDGLPLALDQAAAYIEENKCSVSSYLKIFRSSSVSLLQERDAYADHPQSIVSTFTLLFKRLEQDNMPAVEILIVCSYLSAEAIPEFFFLKGAAYLGSTFEALASDHIRFNSALKTLLMCSLLQRNPTDGTVAIHRLVQILLQEYLSKSDRQRWIERIVYTMSQLFPPDGMQSDYFQICDQLLTHALICIKLLDNWEGDSEICISLMRSVAGYLLNQARYSEAKPLYLRSIHLAENTLSPEHPLMASILHGFATLYFKEGKYEDAEPLYKRALYIREQAPPSEHFRVATTLNKLADLYREQGKYDQAEPLFQRALHICENEQEQSQYYLQITHPLNNLALLYWQTGKYEQAQRLHMRVLDIWESKTGSEHPEVAHSIHNLAILYVEQGKYEEAEPLFKRALHIWERALGQEHLQVTYPLHGLAEVYREQGKYEQAEPLLKRALYIREQTLGREHPLFAYPLSGLAHLYKDQEKYEQAKELFQCILQIREQALGQNHPDVAETLHHLAGLYQTQQNYTKALTLYQRALKIRQQALGSQHPKTIATNTAYNDLLQKLDITSH